jgi:hypothetical protein
MWYCPAMVVEQSCSRVVVVNIKKTMGHIANGNMPPHASCEKIREGGK